MILSEISIRRPVLATVVSLMIVLLGYMAFERLPVREYPDIDQPVVSVRTVYEGASAEVIESQVTRPLEDSLAGLESVDTMKSSSREEVSEITIRFLLQRDPDAAAADVRDRVSRVRGRLPDDVEEPIISKVEADAIPIVWIAFTSDRHDILELTDYADRHIQDRLQTIPGVARVVMGGDRNYAMRLWLEAGKLAAHGVTVGDVEQALRSRNVEIPGGRIESTQREFTVLAETDLHTPEQFNDLIIREANGRLVRLRDVGYAELGAQEERKFVRMNGRTAVGLGVVKQSKANTLAVARQSRAEIERIAAALPEGMKVEISFDSSIFINASIREVFFTLLQALVLVTLVTFLFLRTLRATLIPFVTIPVSLVGSYIFIYALGFSVNVLTLLGLVLAIGLVVDDAIVMLENVHRRVERGMQPMPAALEGSREIGFAIIAMTLTLATVFAPLALLGGNTGRLFTEFAMAVAGAVLISGFVALTLSPMMCSRLLRPEPAHGRLYTAIGNFLEALTRSYQQVLRPVLRLRWYAVLLLVAVAGASVTLFRVLKGELSPLEDRGFVMAIISTPEGSSVQYTDRYARILDGILKSVEEVSVYFTVVAPGLESPTPVTTALGFISLKPWRERERSQQEIAAELLPKLLALPGALAFSINPPSLGQGFRSQPVQFVIQGPSYAEIGTYVGKIMERARAYPGLASLDTDLKLDKPQLRVDVDRNRAADLGVEVDEIGRALETLLGGRQVTRFKREGEQYDVIIQLAGQERNTPRDVDAIYVRGDGDRVIPLSSLVTVREDTAPKQLNHFNRLRSATITGNLGPDASLSEALDFLEGTAREVLPPVAGAALDGESKEFRESSGSLALTFVFAVLFIYLVLAAQFESFVDPFIILLTVPLAVTGALLALYLTGGTLNVYSQIGLVMLVGLITKNGILIVDFANRLCAAGRSKQEAVAEAAGLRLRPILMTTFAMILGALPLAVATGAGAESRQQIGWVIVGGLAFGTILTLFVIPAAYLLLSRAHRPKAGVPAGSSESEAVRV
ncbi:MAG: efflux RND transporter permease subunit [Gammaproteobacteria bacterium]|nr:efflux RND transporter permease subunit [Gammaproteobacteria bacterium]